MLLFPAEIINHSLRRIAGSAYPFKVQRGRNEQFGEFVRIVTADADGV